MFRRRRVQREIPFSFDSFLDVVANVVGIILRLILVAWAGARTYKAFVPPPAAPEMPSPVAAISEPADPLSEELQRQRRELAQAQALLLERIRDFQRQRQNHEAISQVETSLRGRLDAMAAEEASVEEAARSRTQDVQETALSLDELRVRTQKLCAEIAQLRQAPPLKKTLRHRTPVSQPVQSEEWMFECRAGRVTLIDIGTLLDEARRGMREKAEQLRSRWEVTGVTSAAGAFRLQYTLQRERSALDVSGTPSAGGSLRCALTAWEVEPVAAVRGENIDVALKPDSEFRRLVDHLDPRQAALTLWVYPDSFALYRRLRDYLHEHDFSVAGRPLPEGAVIAASREGSVSRAQ